MYRFTVSGIPPTYNRLRRMVFREIAKEKRSWVKRVRWSVRSGKKRPKKPLTKAFVIYTFYFQDLENRDASNFYGAVKMLEDGLVAAKILEDDSIRHTYPIAFFKEILDGEEEKVIIEVIPNATLQIEMSLEGALQIRLA